MSVVSRAGDVVMFLTGNDLSDLERDIYYLKIFQISSTTLLDFFSDICISFPGVTFLL